MRGLNPMKSDHMQNHPATDKNLWGILLISVSAVGYGLQPVFGKLAYAEGMTPSTVTFGRFLLAVALFELHYLFLPKGAKVSARELLTAAGIGVVYAAATVCYYLSLQYLSPLVFSFVYYTYPAMTLFVGALLFGGKITRNHLISTALLVSGTALLLSGGEVTANTRGVLWILGCALCMALFFQLQQFLPKQRCELYHARIMLRVMAAVFLAWWLMDGAPNQDGGARGFWWVLLIGLLSTYIAFTAAVMGIARLGAAHAALLSGQEPLWTALFSFVMLGLALDAGQWAGAAMMLAAICCINYFAVRQTRT